MEFEVVSTNRAALSVIEGTAPRTARMAAARGALPLPQADLLEVLVHLAEADDGELAETARNTLRGQDNSALEGLFKTEAVAPKVLAHFTKEPGLSRSLYEAALSNPQTPSAVITDFAATTDSGELLEFLALNQQLLIQSPAIIDAIIANPHRTAEAGRRATETKREFFEKERGAAQIASELRARGQEAAAEFIEQAEFSESIGGAMTEEDAVFIASHIEATLAETDDSWLALEYLEDIYEETDAQREAAVKKILGEWRAEDGDVPSERVSMLNRILRMGVKDRVKLAMRGDREARNILVRDPNRLVAQAVATNPRITEKEVEMIAAMRSVPEDVLRQISINRQWTRSYPIMHNLVRNPRTPLANAMTVMTRLQLRDLVALSKNRNVPDSVRRHALRLTQARAGK